MTTTQTVPGFGAAQPDRRVRFTDERLSVIDWAQTMAVFYVAVWTISPPLFANEWARWAAVVAVGVWVLGELTRSSGIILRPGARVLTALVFMGYTAAVSAYVDGVESVFGNVQLYVFILFLIFFEGARRAGLKKYRWVLWGVLAVLPIWMIATLSALATDRFAARLGTRNSEESIAYASSGVGGYGLVYAVVLAIPAFVYLMRSLPPLSAVRRRTASRAQAVFQKLLVVACTLLGVALIVRAGFSIALTALGLGMVTYFLLSGRGANRSFRMGLAVAIAAVAVALSQTALIGSALDGLIEVSQGTSYRSKLEDIRASLETDTSQGTVYDRAERYTRSLTLFFENPAVGTLSFRDVGKHSAILDTFAQFGIFGGAAFVYLLFGAGVTVLRASASRPQMANAAGAFLVMLMICTIFNGLAASMGVAMYILFPLAMTYGLDQPPGGRWRTPPRPVRGGGPVA